MKLIIQIPCYNEAKTLEIALNDLPKHIDGIDTIEYLIINDGSVDNTVEVARRWGVQHVVDFKKNRGLAKGFMAGLDACLGYGADIIVNTDADDQYNGEDIEKLVRPILNGEADIVIGARPIDDIPHFSKFKKKMQHLGSYVVSRAASISVPDAPSGFRAFSREAAFRLNVTNDYTYTLETIVQAGREKIPLISVPVRTNPELRPSRLFSSIGSYMKKSMVTIIRAYIMYKPLTFFTYVGLVPFLIGLILYIRYLCYLTAGHTQSLILGSTLMIMGFITFMIGICADTIASNRKILEGIQVENRRAHFGWMLQKEQDEIRNAAAGASAAENRADRQA